MYCRTVVGARSPFILSSFSIQAGLFVHYYRFRFHRNEISTHPPNHGNGGVADSQPLLMLAQVRYAMTVSGLRISLSSVLTHQIIATT